MHVVNGIANRSDRSALPLFPLRLLHRLVVSVETCPYSYSSPKLLKDGLSNDHLRLQRRRNIISMLLFRR